MTTDPLAALIGPTRAILFDFDGPICSVFDGYPAQRIADELRQLARAMGDDLKPTVEQASSPHDLLLAAADDAELAEQLERALQRAELEAIETAKPTPGAAESIAACVTSGRAVAIVSNNFAGAVSEYLETFSLSQYVRHVEGRSSVEPTLMKPNAHLILNATRALGVDPLDCVFIGDQVTDVEAGRAAGMKVIGYANKPGKSDALTSAGANLIVTTMNRLAEAIRST